MPNGIFPPFYLLANVDIWVKNDDMPQTLADMENAEYYMRYGRPHWGALGKQRTVLAVDIRLLAMAKILGGSLYAFESGVFTADMSLAILGVRLCIDVAPQSRLSHDLVAQHMRAMYFISPDRDSAITGYFSEPVLVEAAAYLTNFNSAFQITNRWKILLEALVSSLRNGIVDAGFRGELAGRILLLLAWDRCCLENKIHSNLMPTGCIFLSAVPLVQFLDSLLHLNEVQKRSLKDRFGKPKRKAWVRCSHFIKLNYSPNTGALLNLFRRGAVGITKNLQAGVDLLIPIVFCKNQSIAVSERMVSCVLVQIKNRKDSDKAYPGSATSTLTPGMLHLNLNADMQFLSLYMSLGPRLGPKNSVIEMPSILRELRSRTIGEQQLCLAVFSMSSKAYKVLDESIIGLLGQIGQGWIDPLTLHDNDEWACNMVRSMLPCEHETKETT
jgi:hypothetical protein